MTSLFLPFLSYNHWFIVSHKSYFSFIRFSLDNISLLIFFTIALLFDKIQRQATIHTNLFVHIYRNEKLVKHRIYITPFLSLYLSHHYINDDNRCRTIAFCFHRKLNRTYTNAHSAKLSSRLNHGQ